MSLRATVSAAISATQTETLDHGVVSFPATLSQSTSLTDGTAAGMVDILFSDQRTLAASATEDLDLAGTLENAVGAVINMAKVKGIMIKAASGNTNDVVLSRSAANGVPIFSAAGDAIVIKPGGVFLWLAPNTGVTVTAGTGDLITLANSAAGTPVTYDIVILGTSA